MKTIIDNSTIKLMLTTAIKYQNPKLNDENIRYLVNTTYQTMLDSLDKFLAGQQEHGGKITDRNCIHELEMELIDASHYLNAIKYKRDCLINRIDSFLTHANIDINTKAFLIELEKDIMGL